jgi:hypothetical protein
MTLPSVITITNMYAFLVFPMYFTDPAYRTKFTGTVMNCLHSKFHRCGCRIVPLQGPDMWAYRMQVGETPVRIIQLWCLCFVWLHSFVICSFFV